MDSRNKFRFKKHLATCDDSHSSLVIRLIFHKTFCHKTHQLPCFAVYITNPQALGKSRTYFRNQAKRVIFEYVEVFYNRIRRHAKINNQSPADFAIRYAINNKIAAR